MTNKKILTFATLIALLISITGGFIVYADLTQRLDIKGSADFVPQSWKINFKADSLNSSLTGMASIIKDPLLTDTMISDYEVALVREGDSVTYTFEIANTGSIDAKLTTFSLGIPSCTGTEGATKNDDENIVCGSNLTYTLKYVSGDLASNGLVAGNNISVGDNLKSLTTVKVALELGFSSSATQLPKNTVTIDNLDTYLIYSAE
ncbi:MAG: hypothetical protein GX861_03920 [Tenericutes bacterium]|nr:hypothetical protein [Mycoplasmatota bacterium]